ncbi:MAG: hypothetical protein IPH33_12810 [Bacteroidetes bacterium]|nr:hypothetical protein [Bacteroidota bacterium]
MQYINPIEILGLSNVDDTTSIDNEIVKKQNENYLLTLTYQTMDFLNITDFN